MPTDYFFKIGSQNQIIRKLKEFFNSRSYLKNKNNKTLIFDTGLQASIAEYQTYNHLKTQDGSLNAETYERIGEDMSDVQIDIISLHDPNLRKLLYGVGLVEVCAGWEAVAPVIPPDKFIGWGYDYPKTPQNCFSYCWKQLQIVGHDLKSSGWGTSAKMNPHIYQLFLVEDIAGMKKGYQKQQFTEGVLYLKKALKSKTPVMVGVDDSTDVDIHPKTKKFDHANTDHVTDHYVVIVGMGTDATGKYFLFYDNALNPDIDNQREISTSPENKLYCDCDNFIIKGEGDKRNKYIQKTDYKSLTVTHIRESK